MVRVPSKDAFHAYSEPGCALSEKGDVKTLCIVVQVILLSATQNITPVPHAQLQRAIITAMDAAAAT